MARPRQQPVEAQRHAEGQVVKAAQRHVVWRVVPLHPPPLHLIQGLLVGRWQLVSYDGEVESPCPIAHLGAGERVGASAGETPAQILPFKVPVRTRRGFQASRLQCHAEGGHALEQLLEALVLGQQEEHLSEVIVMGRVEDEEGEHPSPGGPMNLEGLEQEGRALAVEDSGDIFTRWPQRPEPHGTPVIQRLHESGHVHPLLQRQEFRGRGARQKGSEERLPVVGGEVGPARGHGLASTGWRLSPLGRRKRDRPSHRPWQHRHGTRATEPALSGQRRQRDTARGEQRHPQ